ncbi:MAG: GNAT family N-acetyltransferase, partial [Dehalococcoidia bacterium]
ELFTEGDEMNLAAMPDFFRRVDSTRRRRDEFFDLILADDKFALMVAEADASVVGFVQAHIEEARRVPNLVPRETLFIDILMVTGPWRGNGVGKALMERTYDWGRERSVDDVELNVYEFNAEALAFYDRLGYATSSRRLWRELPG